MEPVDLIKLLNDQFAEYIIIGAQALAAHGYVRATNDKGDYEGVPTYYAGLEDLIKMKEAAGRPEDLKDVKVLKEIKKQQSQQKK